MVIPRIKFEIDPNDKLSGVKVMSLVYEGAISSDFVFLSKSKNNYVQLKGDNYKQIVAGLALIPDKDILRFDALGEPFYGYFTKESIETIRNKFHQEQLTTAVNTDHDSKNYVNAFLIESFIIDSEQRLSDVKAKGIEEATIGSWYVAYKIEDKETFERVLSGELKGFSVEIFLSKIYKHENNFNSKDLQNVMNGFLEKFKALLTEFEKAEVKKFERANTSDGKIIEYGAKDEPVNIVTINADGSESLEPAPDGDYQLDNGFVVSVASGIAADVKEAPVEQEKKEEPNNKAEEQFKNELAGIKTELARAKEDLKKANDELEKLKKNPLVNPVVKTDLKKKKPTEEEIDKMSNADKLRLKYKIN